MNESRDNGGTGDFNNMQRPNNPPNNIVTPRVTPETGMYNRGPNPGPSAPPPFVPAYTPPAGPGINANNNGGGPGAGQLMVGRLFMLSGDQQGREYRLENKVTTLGRAINNDIVIADGQTSRRHLQIVRENNFYHAVDAGSANGFYVNERQEANRAQLTNGDIITIGAVRMAFKLDNVADLSGHNVTRTPGTVSVGNISSPSVPIAAASGEVQTAPPPTIDETNLEHIVLRNRPTTSIGREMGANDVVLDNPQVSRRHLQVLLQNGIYTLRDLRSTNGTYVNGNQVKADTLLNDGDLVNIGPYRFMFIHGALNRSQDDDTVRVDALNLTKTVKISKQPTNILQNITFTILPREFVAIVGGSGAGKSTLLDALSGVRPATGGAVLYNKSEYYNQMDAYRSAIGYVPQDDIVPVELSVYKALYYAARLRLPQDTSDKEINERLEEVMDDLDLTKRRDTPIRLLSGGQRKRVSIGAELISKPSLFYLDEPTSGLDPGLEARMMRLLRKLADQGRTVVLITHATQNVQLCDQVLFLARGGNVAFYGSPADALIYFGVANFADIYVKLEQERTPEEWAGAYQASIFYHNNVAARLKAIAAEATKYGVAVGPNGSPSSGQIGGTTGQVPILNSNVAFRRPLQRLSALRQFGLFTHRYFEILTKDVRNLSILLLQAPVVAFLLLIGFRRAAFDRSLEGNGDFVSAKTVTFLLVIVAVWFGTNNSAREIVKEAAIYKRERRIGLKLAPYLASKMLIQLGLVFVQVALLLAITVIGLGFGEPSVGVLLLVFLTLLLVAFSGVMMGLMLSALNSNSDRVSSTVPLFLIPQIVFGGAIVSLERMGIIGNLLGNITVSNWAYHALGTLIKLDTIPSPKLKLDNVPLPPEDAAQFAQRSNGQLIYDNGDWFFRPARPNQFDPAWIQNWLILFVLIIVFGGLIVFFQLRKDKDYSK